MGVPEVWRYEGSRLTIFELVDSDYTRREQSLAFPRLTAEDISGHLEESERLDRLVWLRNLRNWIRTELSVS
jgi:hypothetical protein